MRARQDDAHATEAAIRLPDARRARRLLGQAGGLVRLGIRTETSETKSGSSPSIRSLPNPW